MDYGPWKSSKVNLKLESLVFTEYDSLPVLGAERNFETVGRFSGKSITQSYGSESKARDPINLLVRFTQGMDGNDGECGFY